MSRYNTKVRAHTVADATLEKMQKRMDVFEQNFQEWTTFRPYMHLQHHRLTITLGQLKHMLARMILKVYANAEMIPLEMGDSCFLAVNDSRFLAVNDSYLATITQAQCLYVSIVGNMHIIVETAATHQTQHWSTNG